MGQPRPHRALLSGSISQRNALGFWPRVSKAASGGNNFSRTSLFTLSWQFLYPGPTGTRRLGLVQLRWDSLSKEKGIFFKVISRPEPGGALWGLVTSNISRATGKDWCFKCQLSLVSHESAKGRAVSKDSVNICKTATVSNCWNVLENAANDYL